MTLTPEQIETLAAAGRAAAEMRDPYKPTLAELRAVLAEFIADHLDVCAIPGKPGKCVLRVKNGLNTYTTEQRFAELQAKLAAAEAEESSK